MIHIAVQKQNEVSVERDAALMKLNLTMVPDRWIDIRVWQKWFQPVAEEISAIWEMLCFCFILFFCLIILCN